MKAIRAGLTYNTETATKIGVGTRCIINEWNEEYFRFTLYQTRGGAFFTIDQSVELETEEVSDAEYLNTWTLEEAQKLVLEESRQHFDWASPNTLFDDPPEAERQDSPSDGLTVHVRMPRSLKEHIEKCAKADGTSINAWMMRCAERCVMFGAMTSGGD